MAARVIKENLTAEEFDQMIRKEVLDAISKQFSARVDLDLIQSRLYQIETSLTEIHDSVLRVVGKGLDFVLKQKETRGTRGSTSIEIIWELVPKTE